MTPQGIFTVAFLTAFASVILTLLMLNLHGSREAHRAGSGTSERLAIVISTLDSIVDEVQMRRQPTLILAEAENDTYMARLS